MLNYFLLTQINAEQADCQADVLLQTNSLAVKQSPDDGYYGDQIRNRCRKCARALGQQGALLGAS